MDTSSEYTFPIFISSTDYNLKDLRAELARFLTELGYKPFLSSAEGFPDNSPNLEPWESCIPVLDKCFVMVLVIDGRYGAGLKWPNYSEYFSDKRIAPTHGEYIYAHRNKKRMLVFIRKALMPHYQSYRTVMERCSNNKEEAEKLLTPTLPDYVTFQTLDFINEVKTTKPIPWINEFEDITSVKREIQKKMLNELAELFLVKNKHFETVIESFNKVMDSLSLDKQKEVLQKINATKEITEAVGKLEEYKSQIEEVNTKLEEARATGNEDKEKYEKQIKVLRNKVAELEKETLSSSSSQFFIKDGHVKIGNPNYIDNGSLGISGSVFGAKGGVYNTSGLTGNFIVGSKKCDNCGKLEHDPLSSSISFFGSQFKTCPSCNRYLCNDCWPRNNSLGTITISTPGALAKMTDKCPKCVREGK
ncbi:hypothetical protein GCM10023189_31610 [Nibrella saemangeumensis]|uniref:DUF4062 domain-containing protein n=1 Tax=Nibrella saemangeumensis TaxID=1084526 RepID=A0ABP8MZR3_9BACT